jgi:hypothetical protein
MKMAAFWDIVLCSLTEVDQCFRDVRCLHCQGALLMDAVHTSETYVLFTETTWRYISEGCHIHGYVIQFV